LPNAGQFSIFFNGGLSSEFAIYQPSITLAQWSTSIRLVFVYHLWLINWCHKWLFECWL